MTLVSTRLSQAIISTLMLILLSVSVPALAQEEAQEQQAIEFTRSDVKFFTIDHAVFRHSDDMMQIEAYALVDRAFLETQPAEDGDGVEAKYEITFQILQEDSVLMGDQWIRTDWSADDSSRQSGQKIPELVKYMIKPGDYRLAARVVDIPGRKYYVHEYPFTVEKIGYDEVGISDLILASRIEQAQGDVAEFDHNGLLVLPNAERMFGVTNPQIFYYTEIYNLTEGDTAEYWVDRALLNDRGAVVRRFDRKVRNVAASNVVDVDVFSAATLRTGGYTLRVAVTDVETNQTAVSDRKFWVYRQGEEVQAAQTYTSDFDADSMTDIEVEEELSAVRYLLSDNIRKAVADLEKPQAKRAFLSRFWAANDPDSTTIVNEFRVEYLRRLQIANDRYGTLQREGWSTDRGRVLLMNGEPDYIDDHPFDSTTNGAWQVWEYNNIEGGVIYVFVDRNNLGEYTQVHSTKKGEIYNPEWYRMEFSR